MYSKCKKTQTMTNIFITWKKITLSEKKLIKNPVTYPLAWFYLSVLNLFVLIQFFIYM